MSPPVPHYPKIRRFGYGGGTGVYLTSTKVLGGGEISCYCVSTLIMFN